MLTVVNNTITVSQCGSRLDPPWRTQIASCPSSYRLTSTTNTHKLCCQINVLRTHHTALSQFSADLQPKVNPNGCRWFMAGNFDRNYPFLSGCCELTFRSLTHPLAPGFHRDPNIFPRYVYRRWLHKEHKWQSLAESWHRCQVSLSRVNPGFPPSNLFRLCAVPGFIQLAAVLVGKGVQN